MPELPSRSRLFVDVLLYAVARLLLIAALTGVIYGGGLALGVHEFPVMIALLFAIVLGLPLGIWLFAPLRRRATAGIAAFDERRRTDREELQSRLRGDDSSR